MNKALPTPENPPDFLILSPLLLSVRDKEVSEDSPNGEAWVNW